MKKSASFLSAKSNSENDGMIRNSNNQQQQPFSNIPEGQVNQITDLKKSLSGASSTITAKFASLSAGTKKEDNENAPMLIDALEIGAKSLSSGLPSSSLTSALSNGATESASKKARV